MPGTWLEHEAKSECLDLRLLRDQQRYEIESLKAAVAKADELLDLILTANSKALFDQYLHGYAARRWESIQLVAGKYDEVRETSRRIE